MRLVEIAKRAPQLALGSLVTRSPRLHDAWLITRVHPAKRLGHPTLYGMRVSRSGDVASALATSEPSGLASSAALPPHASRKIPGPLKRDWIVLRDTPESHAAAGGAVVRTPKGLRLRAPILARKLRVVGREGAPRLLRAGAGFISRGAVNSFVRRAHRTRARTATPAAVAAKAAAVATAAASADVAAPKAAAAAVADASAHSVLESVCVPAEAAGVVIGRGRENLRKIQQQCAGVRVFFKRGAPGEEGGGERLLTITGPSAESVASAKALIMTIVDGWRAGGGAASTGSGSVTWASWQQGGGLAFSARREGVVPA